MSRRILCFMLIAAIFALASCEPEHECTEAESLGNQTGQDNTEKEYLVYKPVIYLYPESETDVEVILDYAGELTCVYPEYDGKWEVTAFPDGTLVDGTGLEYNYLYWEGVGGISPDFSEGFCISGEDTARFLEASLAKLGLNRREANEFVVYWLPQMQVNKYNLISFQFENYCEAAELTVTPAPDTIIRVFMSWKPLEEKIDIVPQELLSTERHGFTLVEWGGQRVE